MKKLIFTIALSGLLFTSCSNDEGIQQTQEYSKSSEPNFSLTFDVDEAASALGDDMTNLYDIKNRMVHPNVKESEVSANVVYDYVENSIEDKVKLKCFKFTTTDHQFTHSLVEVNGVTLSVFGWKKEDGTWGFLVAYSFPGEKC